MFTVGASSDARPFFILSKKAGAGITAGSCKKIITCAKKM
jgi:hypothetical protein